MTACGQEEPSFTEDVGKRQISSANATTAGNGEPMDHNGDWIDSDGDGVVDADTNGDGVVSQEEIAAAVGGDSDADNTVSSGTDGNVSNDDGSSSVSSDDGSSDDGSSDDGSTDGSTQVVTTTTGGELNTSVSSDDRAACAAALGGSVSDVQVVSSGMTTSVTRSSILYLDISGNKTIAIDAAQSATIKGYCVRMRGGAALALETAVKATGVYYDGSGSSSASIVFGGMNTLTTVAGSLHGDGLLELTGVSNCSSLSFNTGSSEIVCH
jgi:hypothetical protein